jgi:hypothetical protein
MSSGIVYFMTAVCIRSVSQTHVWKPSLLLRKAPDLSISGSKGLIHSLYEENLPYSQLIKLTTTYGESESLKLLMIQVYSPTGLVESRLMYSLTRFLQFIYGEKPTALKITLKKGLDDPSITCLILSNLNRAIGLHESVRLHKLPLRFMIRDYGLPPDLILAIDSTEGFEVRSTCFNVGSRMPDMNLTQHPINRGFAVRQDFEAVDSDKECFRDWVMLDFHEAIAVMKQMLENCKFGLFA